MEHIFFKKGQNCKVTTFEKFNSLIAPPHLFGERNCLSNPRNMVNQYSFRKSSKFLFNNFKKF